MQFQTWPSPLPYVEMLERMRHHVFRMVKHEDEEVIWFLQHQPVYTVGYRARHDIPSICANQTFPNIPFVLSNRGGQITFHGPGQRIVYVMINLKARRITPDCFLQLLHQWVIDALAFCNIHAWRHSQHIGIWTNLPTDAHDTSCQPRRHAKIASIGLRITHDISWHGIALNVCNDLTPFQHITPCGLHDVHMTSTHSIDATISMQNIDDALRHTCPFELSMK